MQHVYLCYGGNEDGLFLSSFPADRPTRIWEPDSSGEDILFVRSRDSDSQVEISTKGVGAQTMTWQYYSSDEFESEISFRLSDDAFTLLPDQPVHLHADCNKRHQYKVLGAT